MSAIPTITLYRPDYDAKHPELGGTVIINLDDSDARANWMAQGFRDVPPSIVLSQKIWSERCSLIWKKPGDEKAGSLLKRSYEEITGVANDDDLIANKLPLVLDTGERVKSYSPNTKNEVIQALFEILYDAHFNTNAVPSKSLKYAFENAEIENKALRARCESIVDLAVHRNYIRLDNGTLKKAFPPAVAASSSDQSIDWLKREKEKLLDQTIANELNRIEKESHVEVEKIKADLRSSGHCIGLVIDRLEKLRYKTLRQCGNAIISSVVDSLSPEEPGTPEQVELICKQIIERTIPFVNGSTKNWLRIADGMLQANGERCYRTVEALEERAKRTEFGVESHVRNKAQYDLRKRLISLLSARPSVPLVNASILKIDSSDVSVISSTIPGDFQKTESKSTLPRNNQRWKTAREIADVVGNSMQTGGELKKKWDSRSGFYPAVRGWVKRQGGSTKVYDPQEIVDKAIAAGDIRMQDIRRINNDFGLKEATVTPKKPKKKK